jgi:hypothetical protein
VQLEIASEVVVTLDKRAIAAVAREQAVEPEPERETAEHETDETEHETDETKHETDETKHESAAHETAAHETAERETAGGSAEEPR